MANPLCIQLINPNTSLAMTDVMAQTARSVAAPETQILAVCPEEGAPSIEGHFDEAIATLGVLQQIKAGRDAGVGGHIIACFGDPGLLAARELARAPVVGIAEAAMHLATMVATRFSVVTTLPRTLCCLTCHRFTGAVAGRRQRAGTAEGARAVYRCEKI